MYRFNGNMAKKFGLSSAIVFQQIYQDCKQLSASSKIEYKNKLWMRKSMKQLHKELSFFSRMTVQRNIKSLIKADLLITCHIGFDRTKLYRINTKQLSNVLAK